MKSSEFLNKNNPVTREEMQQYLEGKLSSSDKIKVEEKMMDDEFSSEASEGFMENNVAFAEVSTLNAAWEAKTKTASTNGVNYKNWFIGTMIVAVLSISAVAYLLTNEEKPKNEENKIAENNIEENTPVIENTPEIIMTDEQLKEEIIEIKEATNISEKKQITYEKTIAAQPTTVETKVPAEIFIENPQSVETKKIQELENYDTKKIVESNVKMLYIKNLKAVDYSILYTNHIAKKEWILTGTSADKETASSEGVIAEHVIKYIPYKDFLIDGLTMFSKNDYKGALGHLLTIQQQYPDDVNASFYSGLCYYNLGKTRQAIAMFDKTIGNSITTFKEESEWYKSLSLLENGKKSDAKDLMMKIESEGGFYAKAAREKLKTLK
jgi:tetratricopeptide (TPR) repeat protein